MNPQPQQLTTSASTAKPVPYREPGLRSFRTPRRNVLLAARLIADGTETLTSIAEQVGITPKALSSWRRKPAFMDVVDAYRRRIEAEVMNQGIAVKANRIKALNAQFERIEKVIAARAADPEIGDAPGGKSGLLAHDVKGVGAGPAAQVVDVFEFDSALDKARSDILQQIAKEQGGQFEDKKDPGPGGVFNHNRTVVFNFPVLSAEDLAAVENAPTIDLDIPRRRLLTRPSDGAQR